MYSQIAGKRRSRRRSNKRHSKISKRRSGKRRSSGRMKRSRVSRRSSIRRRSVRRRSGRRRRRRSVRKRISGGGREKNEYGELKKTRVINLDERSEKFIYQYRLQHTNVDEWVKLMMPEKIEKKDKFKKDITQIANTLIPTKDHPFDHYLIQARLNCHQLGIDILCSGLNYTRPNKIFTEYLNGNTVQAYNKFSDDTRSSTLLTDVVWNREYANNGEPPIKLTQAVINALQPSWTLFLKTLLPVSTQGLCDNEYIVVLFDDGCREKIKLPNKLDNLTMGNFINVLRIEKTVGHFDNKCNPTSNNSKWSVYLNNEKNLIQLIGDIELKGDEALKAIFNFDQKEKATSNLKEGENPQTKIETAQAAFINDYLRATKKTPDIIYKRKCSNAPEASTELLSTYQSTLGKLPLAELEQIGRMILFFAALFFNRYTNPTITSAEEEEGTLGCSGNPNDSQTHRMGKITKYLQNKIPDFLGLTEFCGDKKNQNECNTIVEENMSNYSIIYGEASKKSGVNICNALIYDTSKWNVTIRQDLIDKFYNDHPQQKSQKVKPLEKLLICHVQAGHHDADDKPLPFLVIVSHQEGKDPMNDNVPMYKWFNENLELPWVLITDANANIAEIAEIKQYVQYPKNNVNIPTQCCVRGPKQAQINKSGHYMANRIDYILFGKGNNEVFNENPEVSESFIYRFAPHVKYVHDDTTKEIIETITKDFIEITTRPPEVPQVGAHSSLCPATTKQVPTLVQTS